MSEPTDDRKLLLAYHRDGSHEAFGQLVGKYSPMVFKTALRRTRDHQLAEDVTQAVFIVLARRAGSLRSHESIAGWLHQTAIFASSSALRAQARQRKHESAAAKSEAVALPPPDESSELTARIEDELHRLPTIHRNVLVLHYLEGKTIPQTAELLGVTHETARKRMSRALERLRQRLARRGVAANEAIIASAIGTSFLATTTPSFSKAASAAVVGGNNGNAFSLASDLIHSIRLLALKKAAAVVAILTLSIGGLGITLAQNEPPGAPPAPVSQQLSPAPAIAAPDALNSEIFGRLNATQRIAVVAAGLLGRDVQLQNFTYHGSASVRREVYANGKEPRLYHGVDEFRFQRKGPAHRIDNALHLPNGNQVELTANWMDNVGKAMVGQGKDLSGFIKQKDVPEIFSVSNIMLGVRGPYQLIDSGSLSDWYNFMLKCVDAHPDSYRVEISASNEGGTFLSRVAFSWPGCVTTVDLDPARGWMPMRISYRQSNKDKEVVQAFDYIALQAQQIDGLWVPGVIKEATSVAQRPGSSFEREIKISNFKVGSVTDNDLVFEFKPGTAVRDQINNTVYTALPNNGKQFETFVDEKAGKIFQPELSSSDAVTSLPPQYQTRDYSTPVGAIAKAPLPIKSPTENSERRGLVWTVAAGAITLALFAAMRSRRRQAT